MHILYAEDSRAIAAHITHILTSMGHQVTHVLDGHAALEAYLAKPPDLILMDVVMPEMDGIQATREIKKRAGKRWIPLIIMTSLASESELLAGLEAGADDYLVKPTSVEVLRARIRAMQRIAEMQDTLFGVIDNVYEGIITIDAKGSMIGFNKGAERIFGYDPDEMLGCNVNRLMPSPYRQEHDGYLSRYLSGGEPKVIGKGRKVFGRRKNGETFPMHLTVTEVPNSHRGRLFIGLVRDVSEEEAARAHIEFLATHDTLTGLPNRAKLTHYLDARLDGPESGKGHLYFIDLDGFKPVNDQLGHEAGDQALIAVASRLKSLLGPDHFVGRLGGDEFVAITTDTHTPQAAGLMAERMIEVISVPIPLLDPPVERRLGASIGIAGFLKGKKENRTALLTRADNAMYQAKQQGKGRWVMAADDAGAHTG
jgi:diguanylate cyclase (GGDEF)-like protein/PAS domain S-box-containing protein